MAMVVTKSNSRRKRSRNEIVVRVVKYWIGIVRSGENGTGKIWFLLRILRLKALGCNRCRKMPDILTKKKIQYI
jgi:hypothetical protein